MSINPSFIHSHFSQNLYRDFVLDECIKGLKPPPFYNKHFFETIKKAIESGHSVENMWVKHWYQFLLEESANHAEQSSFKIERSFPDINWNQVWVNIHLKSLNCEEASFAFKSVHGLLPSDEKISTIFKKLESSCKFGCSIGVANLPHILFSLSAFPWHRAVAFQYYYWYLPWPSHNSIIFLELQNSEAITWLSIQTFFYIWNKRVKFKSMIFEDYLAMLEDKATLLLGTKHNQIAMDVLDLIW